MRKYLDFEDGYFWELSPLTYDEFERLGKYSWAPDIAFGQWKRHNNFHELDDLSHDPIPPIKKGIRIEIGEPVIRWDYCDDAWWV
jgi:hypothetical protein